MNREWHGFVSDEAENRYKNYNLKYVIYFYKKYSTLAFLFFRRGLTLKNTLVKIPVDVML